jgi:hypothetical protein
MKKYLAAALCAGGLVAGIVGTASAAPNACTMISLWEYQSVLHKSVQLTPGEGTSSCYVWIGYGVGVIPKISPYNPPYFQQMWATIKGIRREPSLGLEGRSFTVQGATTTYAVRHGYIITLHGLNANISRAQMILLTKFALQYI